MQLNAGVFESELPLSDAPVLGDWTITAELNDEVTFSIRPIRLRFVTTQNTKSISLCIGEK